MVHDHHHQLGQACRLSALTFPCLPVSCLSHSLGDSSGGDLVMSKASLLFLLLLLRCRMDTAKTKCQLRKPCVHDSAASCDIRRLQSIIMHTHSHSHTAKCPSSESIAVIDLLLLLNAERCRTFLNIPRPFLSVQSHGHPKYILASSLSALSLQKVVCRHFEYTHTHTSAHSILSLFP